MSRRGPTHETQLTDIVYYLIAITVTCVGNHFAMERANFPGVQYKNVRVPLAFLFGVEMTEIGKA